MWVPWILDRGDRPGPSGRRDTPVSPLPTPTTRSLQPRPTPGPCGSISALFPPHPQHLPPPRPQRPPYHALRVHQQQVLGLPPVHAGEDVLPRIGDAVPHEEVPVRPKQFFRRPTAHLAMVPGLLTQLLLRGGDGGPAGRGTGPLILHGKGGCHRASRHRALMQPQGILEGSCGGGGAGGRGGGGDSVGGRGLGYGDLLLHPLLVLLVTQYILLDFLSISKDISFFSNVHTYFFFLVLLHWLPSQCLLCLLFHHLVLTALARTSTTRATSLVGNRCPFLFQTLMEKLLMVCTSSLWIPAGTSVALPETVPRSSDTLECAVTALIPALVCLRLLCNPPFFTSGPLGIPPP